MPRPKLPRRPDLPSEERIPRGAIAVVVVGILACIAAALLTGVSASSEIAHLFWVQQRPMPDSKSVKVPGGSQRLQLVDGGIRSTGTNVAGYSLYRVLTTVRIGSGAPIGDGRILCSVKAGPGTEIAHSQYGLRATYPRSSSKGEEKIPTNGIYNQELTDTVSIAFASHGYSDAIVEVGDAGERYTTERGVKLEWPQFTPGTERLRYYLPEDPPERDLELPFYTIWKTVRPAKASVSCTLTTKKGKATVNTAGSLPRLSPAIDESAEEIKQEGVEETEAAEEEAAEGSGEDESE